MTVFFEVSPEWGIECEISAIASKISLRTGLNEAKIINWWWWRPHPLSRLSCFKLEFLCDAAATRGIRGVCILGSGAWLDFDMAGWNHIASSSMRTWFFFGWRRGWAHFWGLRWHDVRFSLPPPSCLRWKETRKDVFQLWFLLIC